MADYASHDRAVWEGIFDRIPAEWYVAPPSDAMVQCRAYFGRNACRRVLDIGCGFGRWAQYLVGHGVEEMVGIDYAMRGVRAARAWAKRSRFNARFVVGSATALPFRGPCFDGVLAALILDNLSRTDCARAVRALNSVAQVGARGFFVFNPVLTSAEIAAIPDDNPTKSCMHVAYADHELASCLAGWSVTRVGSSVERFRLIEATLVGEARR
jgi:ubiquinone/menaquinone biosynthesis C-methylase UbiE